MLKLSPAPEGSYVQYLPLLRSLEGSRKVMERRVLFEYGCEYFVPCEEVALEWRVRFEDKHVYYGVPLTCYFVLRRCRPAAV